MNTGLDTTQTIRRAPGNLALSTFIHADQGAVSPTTTDQPWILDHRLILHDLPYAEDDPLSNLAPKTTRRAKRDRAARTEDGHHETPRATTPNPFLRSAVGAVGSGAVRRSRQVVTVASAVVLAGLVYLALQGTLLRPDDPPITYSTTPGSELDTPTD